MLEFKCGISLSITVIVLIRACDSANILCIFPAPSFSRQLPMLTLSRALAERGHNLTVITTTPSKIPIKNHREIDISFLYKNYNEAQSKSGFTLQKKTHPNLKLFISQVGVQSLQEAIIYQIPILGIPMFADQEYNAKKLLQSGAGLRLEFDDITFETVYHNLKELLTNKSYKENMARLSAITKDKPMSGIDTAIWWVEYVIRHNGARHLRPASLDLYWFQYFMLDIALLLLTILLFSLFVIYILFRSLLNIFSKRKVKTN